MYFLCPLRRTIGKPCSGIVWCGLQLSCDKRGMPMMLTVDWCWAILIGLIMAINAVFMLFSPRAWFRLPGWLRAQGSFTEDRLATRWGVIHVRLTGAMILAAIAWVLYEMLLS